jgi:6,7-dimethyl-8-ribityllumazine synthase
MLAPHIGIVLASFSPNVTQRLWKSCQSALLNQGVSEQQWSVIEVGGALEIPIMLQHFARSQCYSGLIALGSIIRGETYHFEIVADQSAAGIMRVQLDHHIPIANGILTTENEWQALQRAETKGRECAHTILNLIQYLQKGTVAHV